MTVTAHIRAASTLVVTARQTMTWMSSTQHERTESPFLRLPAELRNRIYELLLTSRQRIIIPLSPPYPLKNGKPIGFHLTIYGGPRSNHIKEGIPLLQTCKQIHGEAASIFYGANSFVLKTDAVRTLWEDPWPYWLRNDHAAWADRIWQWLEKIGQNVSQLRNVTIDLGLVWDDIKIQLRRAPSTDRMIKTACGFVDLFRDTKTRLSFQIGANFVRRSMRKSLSREALSHMYSMNTPLRLPMSSRNASAMPISIWTKKQMERIRIARVEHGLSVNDTAKLRSIVFWVRSFLDMFVYDVVTPAKYDSGALRAWPAEYR